MYLILKQYTISATSTHKTSIPPTTITSSKPLDNMSAKSTTTFNQNDESNPTTLLSLPHDNLQLIAAFLSPPEVHSLNEAVPPSFAHQSTHLPDSKLIKLRGTFTTTSTSTLANALLYKSQYLGLQDVLRKGIAKLSSKQIQALFSLQKHLKESSDSSLLISGSTMVQTMTGLRFEDSDLDFYVDSLGVHALRDFLKELGFVCHRVSSAYHGFHFNDSNDTIHHVETYVLPPPGTHTTTALTLRRRWRLRSVAGPHHPRDPLKSVKNKIRCRNVDLLNDNFTFQHDFPFTNNADNCNVTKICDVIVTNNGSSPQQAIEMFDLDICKCSWDGIKMTNPNGNKTYLNTTGWNNDWGKLVFSYMRSFIHHVSMTPEIRPPPSSNHLKMIIMIMHSLSSSVIDDNAKVPCIEHGFTCGCLTQAFDNTYYRSLHRTILTRFNRMIKYNRRGIYIPLERDLVAEYFRAKRYTTCRLPKRSRNA